MIAVVDYGVGNLFSLMSSLRFLGLDCIVTNKKEDLLRAEKNNITRCRSFGDAIAKLKESDSCRYNNSSGFR